MEKRLKKLALAGIGAAAALWEEPRVVLEELAGRGEDFLTRSGVRNEPLHHGTQESPEALAERIRRLSPEERQALRRALAEEAEATVQ